MERVSLTLFVICCVLPNLTTAKPASNSFVEFTMYETISASLVKDLVDPSDIEYFQTLEPDSKGNYKLPISQYAYRIKHPSNAQDGKEESLENQRPNVPSASAQIISEVQKLLSSNKYMTEMKHSEDTSGDDQDGDEAIGFTKNREDHPEGLTTDYISAPRNSFSRCRNRGKKCTPRKMPPPQEKDRKKISV